MGAVTSPRKLKGSGKAQRIAARRGRRLAETGPLATNCSGSASFCSRRCCIPCLCSGRFTNYDDGLYILENPMIRNLDWGHLKDIFSTIYQNQYAPIATLIMAIGVIFNYARAAQSGRRFAHIVNTVLVFQLIRQLFKRLTTQSSQPDCSRSTRCKLNPSAGWRPR